MRGARATVAVADGPHLTLVIPDLLRETSPRLPALARLLSRSDPKADIATGSGEIAPLLFQLFGVVLDANDPLPVAAVTRAFDIHPGSVVSHHCWIRVDPVHLQLDRANVRLFDHRFFALTDEEAQQLAAALVVDDHLPPGLPSLRLEVAHPTRWYLALPAATPVRIRTVHLPTVCGQDIRGYLPDGEDGRAWRKWLNDSQILLHNSPVNAEREARGEWPINSVWLWGEGCTPHVPTGVFDQVWSHDPLVLGLATLAATPHAAPPANVQSWLNQIERTGRHLIVVSDLLDPTLDAERWADTLRHLEHAWFAPLQAALKNGTLASLTLCPCPAPPRYLTGSWLRWRWWRR